MALARVGVERRELEALSQQREHDARLQQRQVLAEAVAGALGAREGRGCVRVV